jgi:hypothetical protein
MAFRSCAASVVFRALRFRREERVIDYCEKCTSEQTIEPRLGNTDTKYKNAQRKSYEQHESTFNEQSLPKLEISPNVK